MGRQTGVGMLDQPRERGAPGLELEIAAEETDAARRGSRGALEERVGGNR